MEEDGYLGLPLVFTYVKKTGQVKDMFSCQIWGFDSDVRVTLSSLWETGGTLRGCRWSPGERGLWLGLVKILKGNPARFRRHYRVVDGLED